MKTAFQSATELSACLLFGMVFLGFAARGYSAVTVEVPLAIVAVLWAPAVDLGLRLVRLGLARCTAAGWLPAVMFLGFSVAFSSVGTFASADPVPWAGPLLLLGGTCGLYYLGGGGVLAAGIGTRLLWAVALIFAALQAVSSYPLLPAASTTYTAISALVGCGWPSRLLGRVPRPATPTPRVAPTTFGWVVGAAMVLLLGMAFLVGVAALATSYQNFCYGCDIRSRWWDRGAGAAHAAADRRPGPRYHAGG